MLLNNFLLLLSVFISFSTAQWNSNFEPGRAGIVHLFEWHWDTIADECETFLGPNKFAGVQISPSTENRVVDGRPWWERYQTVSYVLSTRSGDRNALSNMIDRCKAVGVNIYADIAINHMTGVGGKGYGTAGTYYDADSMDFPGVPYSALDMNDGNCHSYDGGIHDYGNAEEVRNCKLTGLIDLNQGKDYVRGKVVDLLNDLVSLGVAGFRFDASKHMWPGDLEAIFTSINNLNTNKGFAAGTRPMIIMEVIDQGGEAITASEYYGAGRITEFKYGINLGSNKNSIHYLENFGQSWGMMPDGNALVFIYNHDNQRGHGGGGSVVTFEDSYNLKILNAFMMAWPYGVKRIMSSYYFSHSDEGPPDSQRNVESDGTCGNGWVCEHRWRQIKNMVPFAAAANGQGMKNWWTNSDNQIAFSRGNKAFIAINKASYDMKKYLQTGLPQGSYCNIISGEVTSNGCTGECISVDGSGYANINISPGTDPVVAIHVNAMCDGSETGGGGTPIQPGAECTSCSSCNQKTDCGFLGIDETGCKAKGCMWCPSSANGDPWCINVIGSGGNNSGGSGESSGSCALDDGEKTECGYLGIDQSECETNGCCWQQSSASGVPWCYIKA